MNVAAAHGISDYKSIPTENLRRSEKGRVGSIRENAICR
jgi:hypothetical protein